MTPADDPTASPARPRRSTAGAIAMMVTVMQPGSAAFQPVALLPVAASVAWAVAVIFTRKASGRDGVATTMLHSS